jgi:ribosomal protein L37AE/L43A
MLPHFYDAFVKNSSHFAFSVLRWERNSEFLSKESQIMKCPTCKKELILSKKNPGYALCHNCRKKYKLPSEAPAKETPVKKAPAQTPKQEEASDGEYHFRYANIPPKEVREKQEREMRRAYDELLSIGKEEREKKKRGFFGRRK